MNTIALQAAIGTYPRTLALKDGRVGSSLIQLEFADIPTINRAFAPMVRELRFDVCEMAIATFLQAKACGKALVLLPVVLAARFQEGALLCRAESEIRGPGDLVGKRVGLRAYSQTTGMWLRGILAESHGVRPADIRWVTFEGAHVPEILDPPGVERAAAGKDMLAMLKAGELDAVILGNDLPDDPGMRTVFPDPAFAGAAFRRLHGMVPVNHMLTVKRALAEARPEVVVEVMRMFEAAASLAPAEGRTEPCFGRAALQPAVELALGYMNEQELLPKRLGVADVWEGLPAAVA